MEGEPKLRMDIKKPEKGLQTLLTGDGFEPCWMAGLTWFKHVRFGLGCLDWRDRRLVRLEFLTERRMSCRFYKES